MYYDVIWQTVTAYKFGHGIIKLDCNNLVNIHSSKVGYDDLIQASTIVFANLTA